MQPIHSPTLTNSSAYESNYVISVSLSISSTKRMSQFASKAFSSSKYAAARPRYTTALLDEIMRYHGRRSIRSAELGCGPGTITSYLAAHSDWVLATDPSEQMIREAGKGLAGADNVQLREASAGELPSLLTEPVDLIVSAQAAHWFHSPPNHTADCKLWELLGDALTSGGSLVYLVYGDVQLLSHPHLHAFASFKNTCAPYWQQPGRRFLENLLRDIHFPRWGVNNRRLFYDSSTEYKLKSTTSIDAFAEYLATWSSYSKYCELHPTNTLISDLKNGINEEIGDANAILEMAFPVSFMMCQKL
ncbi:hypothetical protein E3P77_03712 [Wallemia ichthyophaga]|nr:hypothetical protein E3P95_03605 [Wallemia ichthyophaga]TIB28767.1 hypothetical protein E3P84_03953 [Wallemia ichthyophaga]TIB62888.1 hypothetical protein E3P77_03712 [Wallemia ichthyophaga]